MQYTMFVATSLLLLRAGKKIKIRDQVSHNDNYAYEVSGPSESRRRHVVVLTYPITSFQNGIAGIARVRGGAASYTSFAGGQAGRNLTQIAHYGGTQACIVRRGRSDAARAVNVSTASERVSNLPDNACIELYDDVSDTLVTIDLPTEGACLGLYSALANELTSCIGEEDAQSISLQTLDALGATLLSRSKHAAGYANYPYCLYPKSKAVPVTLAEFSAQ